MRRSMETRRVSLERFYRLCEGISRLRSTFSFFLLRIYADIFNQRPRRQPLHPPSNPPCRSSKPPPPRTFLPPLPRSLSCHDPLQPSTLLPPPFHLLAPLRRRHRQTPRHDARPHRALPLSSHLVFLLGPHPLQNRRSVPMLRQLTTAHPSDDVRRAAGDARRREGRSDAAGSASRNGTTALEGDGRPEGRNGRRRGRLERLSGRSRLAAGRGAGRSGREPQRRRGHRGVHRRRPRAHDDLGNRRRRPRPRFRSYTRPSNSSTRCSFAHARPIRFRLACAFSRSIYGHRQFSKRKRTRLNLDFFFLRLPIQSILPAPSTPILLDPSSPP